MERIKIRFPSRLIAILVMLVMMFGIVGVDAFAAKKKPAAPTLKLEYKGKLPFRYSEHKNKKGKKVYKVLYVYCAKYAVTKYKGTVHVKINGRQINYKNSKFISVGREGRNLTEIKAQAWYSYRKKGQDITSKKTTKTATYELGKAECKTVSKKTYNNAYSKGSLEFVPYR